MNELIIVHRKQESTNEYHPVAATGHSFEIHEWSGSGLSYLHIHYADDEAWHIFEENLTFRFGDKQVEAPTGTTVFVHVGVPHTYCGAHGPTRYLVFMTPRLRKLISELHHSPIEQHHLIMRKFDSEKLE